MNILIVKLSAIGDVIHTLPALNALRYRYPEARITWLIEEAAASLVMGHEALDRVLVMRRKSWIKEFRHGRGLKSIARAYRFIKRLRDTKYDMVIDFQSLLKSAVPIALSRGIRKIGFDRGMEHMEGSYLLLNERIPPVDMNMHALTRGLLLLEALGIPADEVTYKLPILDDNRCKARALLGSVDTPAAGPLVAIHPVAKWQTKLWENEKFSILADRLTEQCHARIVFTGAMRDRPAIASIVANMTHAGENLAGKTDLKTLAALYEAVDVVVSTDTGPMHLAAAVDTPVVALFGPTAPWRTGPFGKRHRIIRTDVTCSPCFKRSCATIECMKKITVSQVFEGTLELIAL